MSDDFAIDFDYGPWSYTSRTVAKEPIDVLAAPRIWEDALPESIGRFVVCFGIVCPE